MINKVDRAFFELKHDAETIYQNFQRVIENANVIISTYQNTESMGDCQVYPEIGTVAMGSALLGWGFTITTFVNMYAAKFKTNKTRLLEKQWETITLMPRLNIGLMNQQMQMEMIFQEPFAL